MYIVSIPLKGGHLPEETHKGLDAIFGVDFTCPEVDRGYLFIKNDVRVLARSKRPPVIEGILFREDRTDFPEGTALTLEVILNPVTRSRVGEKPVFGKDAVRAWCKNLLEQHGVQVSEDMESGNPALWADRISSAPIVTPRKEKTIPLFFWAVRALVTVTDPVAFKAALETGVGRKKRYGAGMILPRI